jgi:hypothetical protein
MKGFSDTDFNLKAVQPPSYFMGSLAKCSRGWVVLDREGKRTT